jgi:hypothetical protein
MRQLLALCALALVLPACQTITFVRGATSPAASTTFLHHNGFSGVVELSAPVDLRERCPKGWSRVTTRESVASSVAPNVLSKATGGVSRNLWDPEEVELSCALPAPKTP